MGKFIIRVTSEAQYQFFLLKLVDLFFSNKLILRRTVNLYDKFPMDTPPEIS